MNKTQRHLKPAKPFRLVVIGLAIWVAFIQSTFAQTSTTTSLTSSLNPATEGQAFALTATVTGSSPTGTVTFKSGSTSLATVTLSNGTASFTNSGGAGTYSLTAVYSGDSGNLASTSSVISQVISNYAGVGVYFPAAMEDGMNYAYQHGFTSGTISPWIASSSTTSAINITNTDLSGATTPDIKPIPNSTNAAVTAHLFLNLSGAAGRSFYRPIATNVTAGSVYFSMLMDVESNATAAQYIFSLNGSASNAVPTNTDALTLIQKPGSDASHYQLGIQSLNGSIVYATNQLVGNDANVPYTNTYLTNTYLIVLKYTFGGGSALYINPTPGQAEPTPSATTTPGAGAAPSNIGRIILGMSGQTRGTNHYDVMRCDTNWAAVTPSALESPSTATKLVFNSSTQTNNTGVNSSLITVTLEDQANNPLTNSATTTVVSLGSTSSGGIFYAADGITVITSLSLAPGASTGTFYYNDSIAGTPTITAASGLLTPATQTETILSGCTPPTVYSVTGGGAYCSTGGSPAVGLADSQNGASYQLYSNSIALGLPMSGTGSALNFGNQLPGTYSVVGYITGSPACSSAMSGTVTITENYPATVNVNPVNQSAYAGLTASFSTGAGNTTSPSFQWQVSSNGGSSWANISFATNTTYTTGALTLADNGSEFKCVISGSGACGITTATSSVASLTVTKATTTNILVSSVNPANAGQLITFTATVTGPGVQPSGTVTFLSGSTVLGTGTLSGGVASYSTSGGVSTNSITASYAGDSFNLGSTSSAISQVVETAAIAGTAQMQDGQDYPLATTTPDTGRLPWQIDENSAVTTSSTSFIGIYSGDLSGATVPDIKPLPNTDTNVEAHLQVATPGSNGRYYYRSIGTPATNAAIYFSFLMNVSVNPTGTNEFRSTMLASTASNNPAATDPLSLHIRVGADSSHYNLGVERLNGAVVWATNSLSDNTNYLIVLKYAFGSSSSDSLYINPIPGGAEPAPSASAISDGVTSEPANIGNIGFWESATDTPAATGTLNFDVMRVDPLWANVTPPASFSAGLASIAFSTAPQTFSVDTNSPLMTITLEDQSNNVYTATSPVVVSLSANSPGGEFISATDGTTVISNVTIAAGTNVASFYYYDTVAGNPVLTASSGLLSPGTQREIVNPPPGLLDHFTVTPSTSSTTAGSIFTVTVQAYDSNNVAIANSSLDGSIVTMTSSGSVEFDANGDGIYGDYAKALTNGALTINVEDPKAESVTVTATLGAHNGTSSAVTINPGAPALLQVLLPGETAIPGTATGKTGTPVTETAGTSFGIIVNLVDTNYNVVNGSDAVHITGSGDPSVILPANTSLSAGTITLSVTNIVAGSGYTLTASDISNGSITSGTSSAYSVTHGAIAHLVLLAPGETVTTNSAPGKTGTPNSQTEGVGYTLTVYAFDAYYNAVASSDTIGFGSSDSAAVLPANSALSGGTKTATITDFSSGNITQTVSDISSGGVTAGTTTLVINPVPIYKSVQTGNWEDTNTWQYSYDGVTWNPASATPTGLNAMAVLVTNGYTVTVAANEVARQTIVSSNSVLAVASGETFTATNGFGPGLTVYGTVQNAGTITNTTGAAISFQGGSTYNHARDGGVIPTATWNVSSTCEITGVISTVPTDTSFNQALGNFIWDCTAQTSEISLVDDLKNVLGDLTIMSTGTGQLDLAKNSFSTGQIYVAGNFYMQGGTMFIYSDSANSGIISLIVGGDVVLTGGTLAGGTNTGSTSALIFTNAGTKNIIVNGGSFSGPIHWEVLSNITVNLGTNVVGGTGSFTVDPGAGLITSHASGFVGNFSLAPSNMSLSTAATYTYDGIVAQTGDALLPTNVLNLTISNNAGVTFAQPLTITNLILGGGFYTTTATTTGGSFTVTGPSTVSGNIYVDSTNFIFDASTNGLPELVVESGGTLTLSSSPITVTVLGPPMTQGAYLLVNTATGGMVAGTVPTFAAISGSGIVSPLAAEPEIIGGKLYLSVPVYYPVTGSAPGFFSGVNLWFTNYSGLNLSMWSSSNPGNSISNWNAEGGMQEQPLGSGLSRYSINVNPGTSPMYYIAAADNQPPYIGPVPVAIVTTPDFSNFTVTVSNATINAAGVLNLSSISPPTFNSSGLYSASGFALTFSGTSGHNYTIQASTNLTSWTNIGTGTFSGSPVNFTDSSASNYPERFYRISSQ